MGVGRDNKIEILKEIRFPHSLGPLVLGLHRLLRLRGQRGRVQADGHAPLRQAALRRQDLRDHRRRRGRHPVARHALLRLPLLARQHAERRRFGEHFGRPARDPKLRDKSLDPYYCDMAASIQKVTEEVVLKMAHAPARDHGHEEPVHGGRRRAQLGRQLQAAARRSVRGPVHHARARRRRRLRSARRTGPTTTCSASRAGRRSTTPTWAASTRDARDRGLPAQVRHPVRAHRGRRDASSTSSAHALADGKVCGWFRGRFEFGPRALGARSIIADPRSAEMKEKLNATIKFREAFRPFAPSVLEERARRVLRASHERRAALPRALHAVRHAGARGEARVLPAITHEDGSGRLQTVYQGRPTPPTTA